MTKEQLSCEKMVLQKNLLHYEGLHGRPVSSQTSSKPAHGSSAGIQTFFSVSSGDQRGASGGEASLWSLQAGQTDAHQSQHRTRHCKNHSRPLFHPWNQQNINRFPLPSLLQVSPSSKRRSQTLQPIIEGETAHFWEEIKEEEEEEERKGGEEEEREEERDNEEEEEEEEGESSGGEMQNSEVIMAFDAVTPTGGSANQPDERSKMEEGSGRLALDLRLSSSNASSMWAHDTRTTTNS